MEDLLIATLLDPRFKLFMFPGATLDMREQAKQYLRAAYDADWSPEARALAEAAEKAEAEGECQDVDEDEEGEESSVEEVEMEAEDVEVVAVPRKKIRVGGAALFLGLDSLEPAQEVNEEAPTLSEVDVYLSLPQMRPVLPSGTEANPLGVVARTRVDAAPRVKDG